MSQNQPITGLGILEMMSGFRPACVIGAAAELDIWGRLGDKNLTADAIANLLDSDPRPTTILLDAVAALGLLDKKDGCYRVPVEIRPLLTDGTMQTILPMVRHQMNILRNWSQLAWVAKSGVPGPRQASIRGFEADRAAFIAAMHSISQMFADDLVSKLGAMQFRHLLDVGGASGTWTMAFLRAVPGEGDDIRFARRHTSGRSTPEKFRICLARQSGQRRFLYRRSAGGLRFCLGQRDRPPAFAQP